MRLASNVSAGMQRLFGGAAERTRGAYQSIKKAMSEPMDKPYSKMTPAERMAHDADMFEMDPRVIEKHHQKMIKRYGPDYQSRFDDDFDMDIGPVKRKGWW